jgi:hypothetical protein
MDYILNRCDEGAIEAVAAAVVRRRRDLALFGGMGRIPDPKRAAKEVLGQINIGTGLDGVRDTVRSLAEGIIRREAPDLEDENIDALLQAWIPGPEDEPGRDIPADILAEMIEQFVSFSRGRMEKAGELNLRRELGNWPERYWKTFPPAVRVVVGEYLKGETSEAEYQSRLQAALAMRA